MPSPLEVIAGAQFRSDLQDSNRVMQAEWMRLVNEAIQSTWNVLAASRQDFQVTSADFVLQSGNTASFQVPIDFHSLIDVVYGPDTQNEYSLGPLNWVNRRSPGGWFWPVMLNIGVGFGATRVRLMGSQVFVEPALQAAGTYRLWYCPKPSTAFIVRLATTAALPACVAAGAGPGKTLTGSTSGALSIDGAQVVTGDLVLVKNQASSADDGPYVVTATGSVSTVFVLTRAPGADSTASLGFTAVPGPGFTVGVGASSPSVLAGTVNEGTYWTLTAFTAVESAQAWSPGATIDPILDRFIEMLQLRTAIPAIERDNRASTAQQFMQREQILATEAKQYFSITRGGSVQKMIDTDSQMFRGGFGFS